MKVSSRRMGRAILVAAGLARGGSVAPLSVLDPAFGRHRDEYLASKRGEWPMAVVQPPGILSDFP